MGIKELKYNDTIYKTKLSILNIIKEHKLYWLIDSDIEEAIIEIKNNTLIWYNGIYLSGQWHYGIFKEGKFFGKWLNGIWLGGKFDGEWISGVKNNT